MSYKKLKIWKLSHELVIDIHNMTLTELPKYELYEVGSQIRRSSKSIKSNIVEGYGRRIYINDYIRYLIMSQASTDETIDHLETLYETKSLKNGFMYKDLHKRLIILGKMINKFLQAVSRN